MTQVYKASRKSEGKDGKIYWPQVGFTIFVGEWEGSPSVTLVDERTGERYPCFPPKPRENTGQRQGGGSVSERQPPPHDDSVPF